MLDGSPEVPRDVALATNFWTKICITGFVRTISTMERGLSGRIQTAYIADALHLRDVAIATIFPFL